MANYNTSYKRLPLNKGGEIIEEKTYKNARSKASAKFTKNKVKKITLNLNMNTDTKLIEKLDKQQNKQAYIKELIRKDLEK